MLKNAYRYNIILIYINGLIFDRIVVSWRWDGRLLDIILKDETCDLRARGDVRYNL